MPSAAVATVRRPRPIGANDASDSRTCSAIAASSGAAEQRRSVPRRPGCPSHGRDDLAQQRAVRTGQQAGRRRAHQPSGSLIPSTPAASGLLVAGGALLGGAGQYGTQRGDARCRPRPGTRSGRRGRAARRRAMLTTSSARLRVVVLGTGHREDSAGAPSGATSGSGRRCRPGGGGVAAFVRCRPDAGPVGAHGATCYWLTGLRRSGGAVSGIRPVCLMSYARRHVWVRRAGPAADSGTEG